MQEKIQRLDLQRCRVCLVCCPAMASRATKTKGMANYNVIVDAVTVGFLVENGGT